MNDPLRDLAVLAGCAVALVAALALGCWLDSRANARTDAEKLARRFRL